MYSFDFLFHCIESSSTSLRCGAAAADRSASDGVRASASDAGRGDAGGVHSSDAARAASDVVERIARRARLFTRATLNWLFPFLIFRSVNDDAGVCV